MESEENSIKKPNTKVNYRKKVSKRRRRVSSSSDSSSNSSGGDKRKRKPIKLKKSSSSTKHYKHCKIKEKSTTTDSSSSVDSSVSSSSDVSSSTSSEHRDRGAKKKVRGAKKIAEVDDGPSADIPIELMSDQRKSMAPMTKEEWEKNQSKIRRVFDENTGRTRLIKGDGEVIEEIVSRERHKEINKQATKGDGEVFQQVLQKKKL